MKDVQPPVRDLLATLLSTAKSTAIWPTNELDGHGQLFGIWLLEIEHRGAFAHIVSCSRFIVSTEDMLSVYAVRCLRTRVFVSAQNGGRCSSTAGAMDAGASGPCRYLSPFAN